VEVLGRGFAVWGGVWSGTPFYAENETALVKVMEAVALLESANKAYVQEQTP
jgi:hypothetical protein